MDIWPRWLSRAGNPLQSGRLNSEIRAWRVSTAMSAGVIPTTHAGCGSRVGRAIGAGTKRGERLRLRRPLRYTRETLEKLGFDPQVLGGKIGDLGRKRGGDFLEIGRDRGRLGRSFGCGRAARIAGCCCRLLRRDFGENAGLGGWNLQLCLALGTRYHRAGLAGADASNWLQR